jgi:cysteine desulfurase
MEEPIYFDFAATTPVDEQVIEAMLPYFRQSFGNPSSIHSWGQQAEHALENSRRAVASVLNARTEEIIFTSCGTESDNLALRGAALAQKQKRGAKYILISPVEHPAVAQTARQLEEEHGFIVETLPVDQFGQVHPSEVEASLCSDTALVSVVYANNEIGTINPIAEIGENCRRRGVPFHSDAVQAAAHLPVNVERDQVDLLSIGAHKFYGPKGVGALYVRRHTPLTAVQTGGKQEFGLRAGTQNIPYIVGMARALQLAQTGQEQRAAYLTSLRDRLIAQVIERIPRARLTGHPLQRLPNHASFVFDRVDGNHLLMLLDLAGFACSSGSACKVGSPKPSDVLIALGVAKSWALGSLRITLGKETTEDQVAQLIERLPALVQQARER